MGRQAGTGCDIKKAGEIELGQISLSWPALNQGELQDPLWRLSQGPLSGDRMTPREVLKRRCPDWVEYIFRGRSHKLHRSLIGDL